MTPHPNTPRKGVNMFDEMKDELLSIREELWFAQENLKKAQDEIRSLRESLQICNLERAANYNLYLDEKNARWIANNPNVRLG